MTDDPMADAEDVFRFGFQRFQDHLIAGSLIEGSLQTAAAEPIGLFASGGPLAFLIGRWGIEGDWLGVFQAVAIQFSDEWQVEVVDHLPGGFDVWWLVPGMQDAFVESARWRLRGSFTDRSLELLNLLDGEVGAEDLLLELSLVADHPWNAELLHGELARRRLPERDAWWTVYVNGGNDHDRSAADRIVDWCLGPGRASAAPDTLELALVVLGWMFTSTNGRLRDRATKAATEILLAQPGLQLGFLERFRETDDVYVRERVLAALAGACLRDPSPHRLRSASSAVWETVFADGDPPRHTLLRDYARLVIDLAAERGVAPTGMDPVACRPPYGSPRPRFGLAKARIRAKCEAVGASAIYRSCAGWGGDFGRYVIQSRLRSFCAVSLVGGRPLTYEQAHEAFRREFIDGTVLNESIFNLLIHVKALMRSYAASGCKPEDAPLSELIGMVPELEGDLFSVLPRGARRRYRLEAVPHQDRKTGWHGARGGKLERIAPVQMQLWVANRAVGLGWTERLFPRDGTRGGDRTRATSIERIGKKYQWIAYHELMARLADNFWIAPEWASGDAKAYETPRDLEFTRDVDPTIPPGASETGERRRDGSLPSVPPIVASEVVIDEMERWVFDDTVATARLRLGFGGDVEADDGEWLTLYRYSSGKLDYPGRQRGFDHRSRQEDFNYLLLVAVERKARAAFVTGARSAATDFHDWLQGEMTDGPYLYEAGMRSTWPAEKWALPDDRDEPDLRHVSFSRGYLWESHLDGSLPEGFSIRVPDPWLLHDLELIGDPDAPGVYLDREGVPVIVSRRSEQNAYCLVRKDRLLPLLEAQGLVPLWAGIGERTAWPAAGGAACWRRRWNGLVWPIANGVRNAVWNEDYTGIAEADE